MVKTILVTGSTGWLGGKLCEALVERGAKVVGLARRKTEVAGVTSLTADLATGAGLEKLNDFDVCEIDCCVHLAAVAGWGELGDCLEVNVQGTRRLLDALAPPGGDPACKRFVVASSISTVGTGRGFPPQHLPMADTHPYVGYPWAYALSKWQMEQLIRFIATRYEREDPEEPLDVTMLRIGCCLTDPGDGPPRHLETGIGKEIPIAPRDGTNSDDNSPESAISAIAISDMVECLCLAALKEEFKPGVRTMNVTAEHAFIKDGCTVPQVMKKVYGDGVAHIDFSHYEQPGHERDSLYDNALVRKELGFAPKVNVLTAYPA
jgi:nucleoside-diphosphate-sugar epimerase